jgi:hypothetical protein
MLSRGLSEERDEAREFFHRYRHRILFGTDASATTPASISRGKLLVRFIRRLLERKDDLDLDEIGVPEPDLDDPSLTAPQRQSRYEFWADRGLYLDADALEAIFHGNFCRLVGTSPRPVDPQAALAYAEALTTRVEEMAHTPGEGVGVTDTRERVASDLDELNQIATTFRSML